MGDRERPGAELELAAIEAREIPHDLEQHLTEHVLRLVRPLCAKVAKQRWRELGVERPPRPLLPGPGRQQDRREVLTERHLTL